MTIHRVTGVLSRRGHRRLALASCYFGRWMTSVEIRPSAQLDPSLAIWHPNGIVIGEMVRIGKRVIILQQVTLGAIAFKSTYSESDAPKIGNDVVLGAGCRVLGGVTIGDGAWIGANAVVLKNVPAGAIAAGVPARIVGMKAGPITPRSELGGAR